MKDISLTFYDIMQYPIPEREEFFYLGKKISTKKTPKNEFSRKKKDKRLKEYCEHINKKARIFRSLPFVENIYLCNSMTFNKLKDDSDIDLCIVTSNDRIRTARLYALMLTTFTNTKRRGQKKAKKFCLSFWITQSSCNIYEISLTNTDIYLIYWIAHIVPLYARSKEKKDILIQANKKRLKQFLPNHPGKQSIFLDTDCTQGESRYKKTIEKIHTGIRGDIREKIIKFIRLPLIIRKKNKLPTNKKKYIVVSDHIQKFYQDERARIQRLFQMKTKD